MKNWPTQKYSRSDVAAAGVVLAKGVPDYSDLELERESKWFDYSDIRRSYTAYERARQEYEQALRVVNNWRAIHGFPLNAFQVRLRRCARNIHPHALVSQRTKRVVSIAAKIREMGIKLPTIQDIAGCRAILETVAQVRELHSRYYAFDPQTREGVYGKHKGRLKDYIVAPKPKTGYRSLHLVFEYCSERDDTYNGLKIEVQLRTRLQHAWATAVETVQRFTGQELKAGRGKEDWLTFFKLTSSAFAIMERTPVVEGITSNVTNLQNEILEKMNFLKFEEVLKGFGAAFNLSKQRSSEDDFYYLLIFEQASTGPSLRILPYRRDQYEQATKDTLEYDNQFRGGFGGDAVLVSVNNIRELRRAYPNYYLDTTSFVDSTKQFLATH